MRPNGVMSVVLFTGLSVFGLSLEATPVYTEEELKLKILRTDFQGNLKTAAGVLKGMGGVLGQIRTLIDKATEDHALASKRIAERQVVKTEAITAHLGGAKREAKLAEDKIKRAKKHLKQLEKVTEELGKAVKKRPGDKVIGGAALKVKNYRLGYEAAKKKVESMKQEVKDLQKLIKATVKEYNKIRKKHPELNWIETKGL